MSSQSNIENKDDVESVITTTFSIQGVPMKVFKRFINFCKLNAVMTKVYIDRRGQKQIKQDLCYSIALSQLLDLAETDAKHTMLYDKIVKLELQVKTLEVKNGKGTNINSSS